MVSRFPILPKKATETKMIPIHISNDIKGSMSVVSNNNRTSIITDVIEIKGEIEFPKKEKYACEPEIPLHSVGSIRSMKL